MILACYLYAFSLCELLAGQCGNTRDDIDNNNNNNNATPPSMYDIIRRGGEDGERNSYVL